MAHPEPVLEPEAKSAYELLTAATQEPGGLDASSPESFEDLVVRLLEERGFEVNHGRSAAGGEIVVVEVKKYGRQSRVSVEAVRHMLGMLSVADGARGAIVSSSAFTAAARASAEQTQIALLTIDDLLVESVGLRKLRS